MTGKQFATILMITFIVGIIWLVSDILFNTKPSVPVNPKLDSLLQPINPNFNPRVLEIIRNEVPDTASIPEPTPVTTPKPSSVTSPVPSRSTSPILTPQPAISSISGQALP